MAACPTETKAAGGLGSIAEQEVDHRVDVLLGGGAGRFTQTIAGGPDAGKTVVESAQAKANLTTKDGQTLSLTYGTAGFGAAGAAPVAAPPSQQHTGATVPVWAKGPGGLAVLGTNDHTDLFDVLQG